MKGTTNYPPKTNEKEIPSPKSDDADMYEEV